MVATDIAAAVAQTADLAVAPNVAELAVSTRIQSEFQSSGGDTSTITKPVIVQLSSASRNISSYTVQAGDTVQSVAQQFNVTPETIKWANNLTGDTVAVGSNLEILPISGIAYTVRDGDTVEKLAEKYKSSASLITTYNDLELDGLTTGLRIIIPNGVLPTNERPGYVAPRSTYNYISGYSAGFTGRTWFIKRGTPMYAGNKSAPGNCTAYAYDRRIELGKPLPPIRWGNAAEWTITAQRLGYKVNNTPSVGAIMQNGGGYRNYGHVAIVEEILPNGDIRISEMNASVSGGGFNIVSGRIVSSSVVRQYAYIH